MAVATMTLTQESRPRTEEEAFKSSAVHTAPPGKREINSVGVEPASEEQRRASVMRVIL